MAFGIPDAANANFPGQAEPDAVDFDAIVAGSNAVGVVSGCGAMPAGLLTVTIAAGVIQAGGLQAAVAGAVVTHGVASASPRYDLIVASSVGALSVVAGTPSATEAVFPSIPANSVLLHAVYIPAGLLVILSTYIVDKRIILGADLAAGTASLRSIGTGALQASPGTEAAARAAADTALSVAIAAGDALAIPKSLLTAAGDTIYATASATPARLPKGTAYQAYRTNAGATAPEWSGYPKVAQGRPKISGGAVQWGIPGIQAGTIGSTALSVNQVRYSYWTLDEPVTLLLASFEVTVAPASNANVRVGIYAADTDWQPTGNALLDQAVAVGSGVTGVFSTTVIAVPLAPGRYLSTNNCDVTLTVRTFVGGPQGLLPALGATPYIGKVTAAQAYGVLPNGGTAWTAISGSANGQGQALVFSW